MPAKRIWAEQLPTELPCKKKILAKAIKNKSKLKAVLHRIPEAGRVQPWEYDNEKIHTATLRRAAAGERAAAARQAAKVAAAAEPPALRPAAQLDEI